MLSFLHKYTHDDTGAVRNVVALDYTKRLGRFQSQRSTFDGVALLTAYHLLSPAIGGLFPSAAYFDHCLEPA
jgi:hypothetical protein